MDALAREAAAGHTKGEDCMLKQVVECLPKKNAKTVKEDMKQKNTQTAIELWQLSKAGKKLHAKFLTLATHTFLDRIKRLPLARASLLFQLSVGHVLLQAHLYRLCSVDTAFCPHCGDAPETVVHFVSRCRTFAAERHQHLNSRGLEYLNLSFLFSSMKTLAPLFGFIKATNRFPGLIR